MSHFIDKETESQRGEMAWTKDSWLKKGKLASFTRTHQYSTDGVEGGFFLSGVTFVHMCMLTLVQDFGNGGHSNGMM